MATIHETANDLEWLISEADQYFSRDTVVVTKGSTPIASGTLMGKITASGKYVPSQNSASDGSQTVAGILVHTLTGTTAGDVDGVVIRRHAQVRFSPAPAQAEVDELAALGIIVRKQI